MLLKRISLLLLVAMVFACAPKRPMLKATPDVVAKVAEINEEICSYKGRVSVVYEDKHNDVRFRGYLNKRCDGNFRLTILGLFNSVAYDIRYVDGVVKAYNKGKDVSLDVAYFMRTKGLDTLIPLIRYPHAKVDDRFDVSVAGDRYLLERGIYKVAARADYLIESVSYGEEVFQYSYDDKKLSGFQYKVGDDTSVVINLR